jgi:uncharacterized protein YktB (UPF0637 family)
LEVHQRVHHQITKNYKSIYKEYNYDKTRLQKDLQIIKELIESQKQLIDLYQGQQPEQ